MAGTRSTPFSYGDTKPYAVPDALSGLRGPEHGVVVLDHHLAWSGRREFDLDDEYDCAALYKIVLEEGVEDDICRLLNRNLLLRRWADLIPARQVRALWENRFPELRNLRPSPRVA